MIRDKGILTEEESKKLLFDIFQDGLKEKGKKINFSKCVKQSDDIFNEIKDSIIESVKK